MDIKEPKFRASKNWQELADFFNYEFNISDQDWTYRIAEPNRVDEYIDVYENTIDNEDTKFALMEMIIQSVNDQSSEVLFLRKWSILETLLCRDFELHKFTIYYWCLWKNHEIEDWFQITSKMREIWLNKQT